MTSPLVKRHGKFRFFGTHTVGRTALARTVPQMVRTGDKLVLAWTDEIDDRSKVVSVRIAIADYYRLFES